MNVYETPTRPARISSGKPAVLTCNPMIEQTANRMTVDAFLGWTEGREGRWELEDGQVLEKSPKRPAHGETMTQTCLALKNAIRRAGAPCHVAPDGAIVRIGPETAFEPDVLVYCGPRSPVEAVEIPDPSIVIEVLSQSTAERDHGVKRSGYFSLPSVMHYLILDPERRAVIHHRRAPAGEIATLELTEGPLRLDPPGLAFFVEELFAPK